MTSPAVVPLLAAALLLAAVAADARLTVDYYARSCPRLSAIVSDTARAKQTTSPTTAPGTLRLFFHDCFVGGCDASVLVSSNSFNRAERDADINLSLPGDAFDLVVRVKTALELECPNTVSCSDILALATRDLLVMLGGPFYPVRLGRKDSLSSTAASVENNLPKTHMSMEQILRLFASKGFTPQESVALTGAHTVGFSHCKEYVDRISHFNNGGPNASDPSMDPRYAAALRTACINYQKDPTIATFLDIVTPGKFDNMFFKNVQHGLGLLASDQALLTNPHTAPFVTLYAANQTAFFADFVHAMEKLSVLGVKTGNKGEVRRRCDQFNNLST